MASLIHTLLRFVKSSFLFYIELFVLLLLILACNEKHYFNKTYSIYKDGWSYDDRFDFSFNVRDTGFYRIDLQLDHAKNYPYQNVYIKLRLTDALGKVTSQVLPIDFFDKSGHLYSKCRGEICYLDAVLSRSIQFKKVGTYKISIAQYTRDSLLLGIHKIGLLLDPTT